ncbi:MAG: POTRA domain-containing protein [Ignavibacteria bacterium]
MHRSTLRKISTALVFIITLSFSSLYSQVEGPSTYKIASISTKGNKNYEAATIISYSGLTTGQEIIIPSDQTREAINRLWKIGIFSDVKIYVDKKFGNDVYLVIEVEELPRVEKVEITGNDEYSESDLADQINLVTGEILSDQKLQDIKYNLEKYYADEGYGLAKVTVDKLISAGNEARVRIKIDEGNQLTVRKIIFEGNKNISSSDLKSAMDETSEAVWWNIFDGATFDKKKYEEDKVLIENYYKENGFKDAFIQDDELIILPSKEDVNIKIKINEGKKYYVNNVTFEGNTIFEPDLLYARLGFGMVRFIIQKN